MVPPGSVNVVMVEDNDGDARLMLEILKNGRFPQRVRVSAGATMPWTSYSGAATI